MQSKCITQFVSLCQTLMTLFLPLIKMNFSKVLLELKMPEGSMESFFQLSFYFRKSSSTHERQHKTFNWIRNEHYAFGLCKPMLQARLSSHNSRVSVNGIAEAEVVK